MRKLGIGLIVSLSINVALSVMLYNHHERIVENERVVKDLRHSDGEIHSELYDIRHDIKNEQSESLWEGPVSFKNKEGEVLLTVPAKMLRERPEHLDKLLKEKGLDIRFSEKHDD